MSLETVSGSGARAASASAATTSVSSVLSSSTSSVASSMPSAFVSTTLSDEMRSLFDGQKKLHDQILKLQSQIEEEEAAYLEETAHGNIIRGWDGFIDSKQSRKEAALKKVKPYTESEHLFSNCCFYKTLRGEPSIELADYHPRDESSTSRRRAAAATAATVGGTASSGSSSSVSRPSAFPSSSVTKTPIMERKASFSGSSSGPSTGSATLGRPPKIKKRKRLDRLEVASTASATQSEAGDDDDKDLPIATPSLKKSRSQSTTSEPAEGGEFSDLL